MLIGEMEVLSEKTSNSVSERKGLPHWTTSRLIEPTGAGFSHHRENAAIGMVPQALERRAEGVVVVHRRGIAW